MGLGNSWFRRVRQASAEESESSRSTYWKEARQGLKELHHQQESLREGPAVPPATPTLSWSYSLAVVLVLRKVLPTNLFFFLYFRKSLVDRIHSQEE